MTDVLTTPYGEADYGTGAYGGDGHYTAAPAARTTLLL